MIKRIVSGLFLFLFLFGIGEIFAADINNPMNGVLKAQPQVITAPYSWTGFYAGANVGMDAINGDFSVLSIAPKGAPAGISSPNMSAGNHNVMAGVQAGYNFQTGAIVWGGVADFDWINGNHVTQSDVWAATLGPGAISVNSTAKSQTEWLSTARAKVGLLVTPIFDLYVTGGAAFGQVNTSYATNGLNISGFGPPIPNTCLYCGGASTSGVKVGWTAGAGAEYAINPNWSAFAEYLHYDLGNVNFSYATAPVAAVGLPSYTVTGHTKADGDRVTAGFNYKFGN